MLDSESTGRREEKRGERKETERGEEERTKRERERENEERDHERERERSHSEEEEETTYGVRMACRVSSLAAARTETRSAPWRGRRIRLKKG